MKFHVPDMNCNHCVASITKAITSLNSDAQVVCDLQSRTVMVSDAIAQTPEQILAALDDVGFEATLTQAQA